MMPMYNYHVAYVYKYDVNKKAEWGSSRVNLLKPIESNECVIAVEKIISKSQGFEEVAVLSWQELLPTKE
jgi:hypothetical protein